MQSETYLMPNIVETSANPTELDPEMPKTAKDVPLGGLAPGENASFKEQVQGHAKVCTALDLIYIHDDLVIPCLYRFCF